MVHLGENSEKMNSGLETETRSKIMSIMGVLSSLALPATLLLHTNLVRS